MERHLRDCCVAPARAAVPQTRWANPLDPGNRWVNPVEPQGVRIGASCLDAEAVLVLKRLFGHEVDGYVAPRMPSPYHVETGGTMSPEYVLFDPAKAGIEAMTQDEATALLGGVVSTMSLGSLVRHEAVARIFTGPTFSMATWLERGGACRMGHGIPRAEYHSGGYGVVPRYQISPWNASNVERDPA